MLSASGPIRKAGGGGGGAVRFRPDTKSGVGWGCGWGCGCGCMCCTLQAQYERRGGCLAEEGEVPYMKEIY